VRTGHDERQQSGSQRRLAVPAWQGFNCLNVWRRVICSSPAAPQTAIGSAATSRMITDCLGERELAACLALGGRGRWYWTVFSRIYREHSVHEWGVALAGRTIRC